MSVIRGKVFTEREIVPSGKTVGDWPFRETSKSNIWVKQDSHEEFELRSLLDILHDENIEIEEEAVSRTGT